MAAAARALGGLHLVYAAAGVLGTMAPVEHLTPAEWRATLAVNLDGIFHTVRAAVPLMTAGGAIVGTSSIHGSRVGWRTGWRRPAWSRSFRLRDRAPRRRGQSLLGGGMLKARP
jgi:NAD(P)-dependent dehydrogenase (short-subunit alcohol dehydrogenase family)